MKRALRRLFALVGGGALGGDARADRRGTLGRRGRGIGGIGGRQQLVAADVEGLEDAHRRFDAERRDVCRPSGR